MRVQAYDAILREVKSTKNSTASPQHGRRSRPSPLCSIRPEPHPPRDRHARSRPAGGGCRRGRIRSCQGEGSGYGSTIRKSSRPAPHMHRTGFEILHEVAAARYGGVEPPTLRLFCSPSPLPLSPRPFNTTYAKDAKDTKEPTPCERALATHGKETQILFLGPDERSIARQSTRRSISPLHCDPCEPGARQRGEEGGVEKGEGEGDRGEGDWQASRRRRRRV